jgi:hypothetical protein
MRSIQEVQLLTGQDLWDAYTECSDYTEFLQSLDINQLRELDDELVFENILEQRNQVVHIQMEIQRRGDYSAPNFYEVDWSSIDLRFLGSYDGVTKFVISQKGTGKLMGTLTNSDSDAFIVRLNEE